MFSGRAGLEDSQALANLKAELREAEQDLKSAREETRQMEEKLNQSKEEVSILGLLFFKKFIAHIMIVLLITSTSATSIAQFQPNYQCAANLREKKIHKAGFQLTSTFSVFVSPALAGN